MPASRQLWNPKDAFEIINPDRGQFTCMGQILKGRRCRITSGVRVQEADMILRRLAAQEPSLSRMNDDLEELAKHACCGRYRDQHSPSASAYLRRMVGELERSRRQSRSAWQSEDPRSNFSRRPRVDSYFDDTIGTDQAFGLDIYSFTPENEAYASPAGPTVAALLQTIENLSVAHASEVRHLKEESNRVRAEMQRMQERIDQLLRHTSTNSTDSSTQQDCSRQHVARRPLDATCGICLESMADDAADKLVWCKSQCGKSVHKECFVSWQRGQSTSRRLRCVHCRSNWHDSCKHDTVLPREA